MLAHMWGLKTIYYSLINKVGSKASVTSTNMYPLLEGTTLPAIIINQPSEFDNEENCEACKL
jgi:hypothetical protein